MRNSTLRKAIVIATLLGAFGCKKNHVLTNNIDSEQQDIRKSLETDGPDSVDDQRLFDAINENQPPSWSYSELCSKSDLIVIAKTVSIKNGNLESSGASEFQDSSKSSLKCIENQLRVLTVLKGEANQFIKVMTIEWTRKNIVLVNSDFAKLPKKCLRPRPLQIVGENDNVVEYIFDGTVETNEFEPEYILFLQRVRGDEFIPVTGQRWGALSIRILNH